MFKKLFKKTEPQPVEVRGKTLVCTHCKNELFWIRRAQLNRSVSSFLGLDWADRSATCFVCSECTKIEWFLG
jgi:hypothetical protein